MHRVRFQFGIPSVPLPFPFRFPSVMRVKLIVKNKPAQGLSWRVLVVLPFPFRCPSVMRVNPHDETCPCLTYVAPKWRTSAPGLQTPVTSQIPPVPLPFRWGFWQAVILPGLCRWRALCDKSKTSAKQVSATSLNFPSVPLPFSFRHAGKVDDFENHLEMFWCRCGFGIFL